jgi:hypothetical protein
MPVNIQVEGIGDAIQIVQDQIAPWVRGHGRRMADLSESELRAEIALREATLLTHQATLESSLDEAGRLRSEAAQLEHEVEQWRIKNAELQMALHQAKVQLALDIVERISPGLSEPDKMSFVLRLLPSIETLISSPLELKLSE